MRIFITRLLLAAAISGGFVPATSTWQDPRQPVPQPPLSNFKFAGTAQIIGLPADPGTSIQIVLFDAASNYIVCADTTVSMMPTGPGPNPPQVAGYTAALYNTPQCVNPDNKYDFYVNGVWAGSGAYNFGSGIPTYKNVNVSEVALKSSSQQGGVRLVWLYGKVTDTFGRPAVPGTPVTAKAIGAACGGSGKTENLYWVPKAPKSLPVGENGFFWIAIEKTPACQDRTIAFEITTLGMNAGPPPQVRVTTPPYGLSSVTPQLVIASK